MSSWWWILKSSRFFNHFSSSSWFRADLRFCLSNFSLNFLFMMSIFLLIVFLPALSSGLFSTLTLLSMATRKFTRFRSSVLPLELFAHLPLHYVSISPCTHHLVWIVFYNNFTFNDSRKFTCFRAQLWRWNSMYLAVTWTSWQYMKRFSSVSSEFTLGMSRGLSNSRLLCRIVYENCN